MFRAKPEKLRLDTISSPEQTFRASLHKVLGETGAQVYSGEEGAKIIGRAFEVPSGFEAYAPALGLTSPDGKKISIPENAREGVLYHEGAHSLAILKKIGTDAQDETYLQMKREARNVKDNGVLINLLADLSKDLMEHKGYIVHDSVLSSLPLNLKRGSDLSSDSLKELYPYLLESIADVEFSRSGAYHPTNGAERITERIATILVQDSKGQKIYRDFANTLDRYYTGRLGLPRLPTFERYRKK